jgi:c-di-GMP-binding flagellar brake protein YcgR
LVQTERPRARRYPLVASIKMTDLESETQINEQTCDLSLFGCGMTMQEPLPAGTRVRIRIVHAGANFVALGKVAHAGKSSRMGVVFTKIELNQQLVLEKWLAELREMRKAKQVRV